MENYSMLRFNDQPKSWRVLVCRGETKSKWHISLRRLAGSNDSMLKSFRIELKGIRAPDIRQLLQYWDWNLNVCSLGNHDVVELNIFEGLSYNKHCWWVQAQGFLNHHIQLPTYINGFNM
ncbi:cytochrome P450 714C2-like [Pyrus ussuriensis x Pyrus communis]|uniref:Cytochrome P450 714C2-like n=1 Tax=Pyrus ussuriensis x Pyrus communis TaxID=2448454 RepID=A0A5N5EWW1_9ROSA|nr:cytochrome P450 714C2-like [Pyrus ussuriensis x Pyrus communis]KAB2614597.1 cytochrome P450 714C2-like [Pyrus ussuriensis x Pyrus communis]